jgi:hypothetical protein
MRGLRSRLLVAGDAMRRFAAFVAIDVSVGSAEASDDPSILALFPNDVPHRAATVVETTT